MVSRTLCEWVHLANPPRSYTLSVRCEPEEPEPLQSFIAESPNRTSYWPDGIVEDVSQQGLAASSSAESFVRGRSATMPGPQFRKHGLQGQYDSSSMIPHENRGEVHWASAVPSEMRHNHGQVVLGRTSVDYGSQPQPQQRWHPPPHPLSSARYDPTPPPFSSYPHRSHGTESEKDTRPDGQTPMVTITDEQSSIYGNNPYRLVAQDRHVGFDHPPWLSTNQNAALQSSHSGIQNSFSSARSPSSNNLPFITHNQGNTDGMWSSNRNDDGGLFELQYSESESSPDTTQTSAHSFYNS